MTKDELKKIITDLELDAELQDIVFDMIESAKTVDKTLLDGVANVLDNHAEYLEKTADLFDQAAEEYEDLSADMAVLDGQEAQERLQKMAETQEELLDDVSQKLEEAQKEDGQTPASPAAPIDQNLNPTVTPTPAPVDMTPPAPIQPSPVDQPTPAVSQTPGEAPVGDHPSVAQDQQKLEEMQAELQNLTNQTPKTS